MELERVDMEQKYIEVKGLNKTFKRKKESVHALEDINFSVEKGQLICVLGPSGCGKSTLMEKENVKPPALVIMPLDIPISFNASNTYTLLLSIVF